MGPNVCSSVHANFCPGLMKLSLQVDVHSFCTVLKFEQSPISRSLDIPCQNQPIFKIYLSVGYVLVTKLNTDYKSAGTFLYLLGAVCVSVCVC